MGFREYSPAVGGSGHTIPRAILRFLQFVFALTVCGLYGTDLHSANKRDVAADPKWVRLHFDLDFSFHRGYALGQIADCFPKVYAVVVGGFSVVTSFVYGIPLVRSHFFFAWDAILL
jgi:hypothetical protein